MHAAKRGRKTAWLALAASAVIVLAWCASLRWTATWTPTPSLLFSLESGSLRATRYAPQPEGAGFTTAFTVAPRRTPLVWWVGKQSFDESEYNLVFPLSFYRIHMPLWIPLLVTLAPLAWLAALSQSRSRASPSRCPTCRYDLRGLQPLAPCPECGATLAPGR